MLTAELGETGVEGLDKLLEKGLETPEGFEVRPQAGSKHVENVRDQIDTVLSGLDPDDVADLRMRGRRVRSIVEDAALPQEFRQELVERFDPPMAVKAGEFYREAETPSELIAAVKEFYAEAFSDRNIRKNFPGVDADKAFAVFSCENRGIRGKAWSEERNGSNNLAEIQVDGEKGLVFKEEGLVVDPMENLSRNRMVEVSNLVERAGPGVKLDFWFKNGDAVFTGLEEMEKDSVFLDVSFSGEELVEASTVEKGVASGEVRVVDSVLDLDRLEEGEIAVTDKAGPEWVSGLERAAAVLTNREADVDPGVPVAENAGDATSTLETGETVSCLFMDHRAVVVEGGEKIAEKVEEEELEEKDIAGSFEKPEHVSGLSDVPLQHAEVNTSSGNVVKAAASIHPGKLHVPYREGLLDEIEGAERGGLDNFVVKLSSGSALSDARELKAELKRRGLDSEVALQDPSPVYRDLSAVDYVHGSGSIRGDTEFRKVSPGNVPGALRR